MRHLIACVGVVAIGAVLSAQNALTFDAASVKRSEPGRIDGGVGLRRRIDMSPATCSSAPFSCTPTNSNAFK